MKKFVLITALFGLCAGQAQQLQDHIPAEAIMVGSLSSENLLKSVSIKELDTSENGKKILENLSENLGRKVNSLNELGINTDQNVYFYSQPTDSISYHITLVPLKNPSFLEELLQYDSVTVTQHDTYKSAEVENGGAVAWNSDLLALATGNYTYTYFDDYDFTQVEAEMAAEKEKSGVERKAKNLFDYFEAPKKIAVSGNGTLIDEGAEEAVIEGASEEETEEIVEVAVAPIEDKENLESGYNSIPYFTNYQLDQYVVAHYNFAEKMKTAARSDSGSQLDSLESGTGSLSDKIAVLDSIYAPDSLKLSEYMTEKSRFVKAEMEKFTEKANQERAKALYDELTLYGNDLRVVPDPYAYDSSAYDYKDYYEEKKWLEQQWLSAKIGEAMKPAAKSIRTNTGYAKQMEGNSVVNFYGRNDLFLLSGLYGYALPLAATTGAEVESSYLNSSGDFSADLYLDETEAKVVFESRLEGDFAKSYERMLDQKLNRDFFDYINEEHMLGYMTYNISTENSLKEMPKLTAKNLSYYFGSSVEAEDVALATDFIALVIDEEAIAELVRGDMMFVLTDVSQKEVSYTDYEYDEDYNSTEVQKTKMETLPDFLFMASSDNTSFTDKLTRFLIRKEAVVNENGYYSIKEGESELGMPVYFTFRDGIFFMGTSADDFRKITGGTFEAKLSRTHKKAMKAGNFSAYINGREIADQVIKNEGSLEEIEMMNYFKKYGTEISITSEPMKGNNLRSELRMPVPEGKKNALLYIFEMVENVGGF